MERYSLRRTHFWCGAVDQIRMVQKHDDLQYIYLILLRIFDEQIYGAELCMRYEWGYIRTLFLYYFWLDFFYVRGAGGTSSIRDGYLLCGGVLQQGQFPFDFDLKGQYDEFAMVD